MSPLHSLTLKMWVLIYYILEQLYYVLLCWWRPFWIFSCRKFCPRVAEFGDS